MNLFTKNKSGILKENRKDKYCNKSITRQLKILPLNAFIETQRTEKYGKVFQEYKCKYKNLLKIRTSIEVCFEGRDNNV